MKSIADASWRVKTSILTFVLLVVVDVVLRTVDFSPDLPAMGPGTRRINESLIAGQPVRDNQRPLLDVFRDLPLGETGKRPIVWIGNSHQHAINALKPGDRLSSTLLHVALNGEVFPGERPAFGISLPNLTFEEQFILTLGLAQLPESRRPAVLVHGLRFHDAREGGVRERVRPLLRTAQMRDWLTGTDWAANAPEAGSAMERSLASATKEKVADVGLEARLVSQLGPYVPIFHRRSFIEFKTKHELRRLRDRVFRIDTVTKRSILPTRYQAGIQFLEAALLVAHEAGIQVLIYNSPLRKEVQIPYVDSEYKQFRKDLAAMSQRQHASFEDYDDLIPSDVWGSWYESDRPDFSHFTGQGHVILADRVRQDVLDLLGDGSQGHAESGGGANEMAGGSSATGAERDALQ